MTCTDAVSLSTSPMVTGETGTVPSMSVDAVTVSTSVSSSFSSTMSSVTVRVTSAATRSLGIVKVGRE